MPSSENIKFTPKFYWENSILKNYLQNIDFRDIWNLLNNDNEDQISNSWIILADKAINGAFKDSLIFLELCKVISDAAERKAKNKGKQNMKYNEAFTNFLVILGSISPRALDLFRQNLERKDNTKLKPQLKYSSTLGCIIGSVLSKEETHISIYSDISNIIANIKSSNGVAKAVRTYLLQIPLPKFPPVVIALIPNKESDTTRDIKTLHKKLVEEIALQLQLHISLLGSDGAITEFQTQQSILNTQTSKKLTISCKLTESLGMIQPADLSINRNNLLISIHKEEVSASYIYSDTNSADIQKIDDISFAISNASKEVEQLSNNLNDNDDFLSDNVFQNGQRQVEAINQSLDSDSLSILNNGNSSNFRYFSKNTNNYEFLLNQCKLHDTYCFKSLEQKSKSKGPSTIKINIVNTVHPNKASHLVTYFAKNENPEQRFIKQREKQ
ncbi:37940_t:CDS:2 [Gigaspora margarita]|uniref:37940_t:CDS:1 n=1 Tax=Gigaspora margarita TaxID=4874 RepID=A0ABN7VYE7_GIGMA|nr:37940_t:CDS:2 [Gigaspora margarita]